MNTFTEVDICTSDCLIFVFHYYVTQLLLQLFNHNLRGITECEQIESSFKVVKSTSNKRGFKAIVHSNARGRKLNQDAK